jgi:hypothetical protein
MPLGHNVFFMEVGRGEILAADNPKRLIFKVLLFVGDKTMTRKKSPDVVIRHETRISHWDSGAIIQNG